MNDEIYEREPAAEKTIREKILHILDNFPKVTPSMLQISLGSGIPTSMWHPVLDKLVAEETLYRYENEVRSPSGRYGVQTVISTDPKPTV